MGGRSRSPSWLIATQLCDLDWLNPEGGYGRHLAWRHATVAQPTALCGAPAVSRCSSAATYQGLLPLTAAAISNTTRW